VTDLSIIVVNWNGRQYLLDCLASIEREILSRRDAQRIEVETLVVDNGSEDGSVQAVREAFAWAQVLELPENLGFARANNVGLRQAKGRYALLLNNDTVVLPDALERCVRHLDANPDVGVVGPQLLNPDGSKQNSIHNHPGLLTEFLPRGLLEKAMPRRFPSKRYAHAEPIEVEAVLGASLFVRRQVLEQVGLMPEDYFFFLEETDWCYQIRQAGWRIVHVPDAHVIHVFGATSKKTLPADTRIEYHRSLYHFFGKHRGPGTERLVRGWRVLKSLLYVALEAPLAAVSRGARERWRRDWKVLSWHLRGRPDGWGIPRGSRNETASKRGKS
jgi:GT2 family glycosyltransferase